jgi:hypothetical protein
MPSKPIDPSAIAALIAQDQKQENEKRQTRIKKGVFLTEPRTYDTWFSLPTHFGKCSSGDDCIDPRDNMVGKTMVANVNGGDICRYCFLAGANKESQ